MKLAIHNSKIGFHPRWVAYCKENNISYKVVDCHANDIIENLKDCDALMWHHHHRNSNDILVARQILFALEHTGFKVFPDFNTGWHFDDKVAQKYLLESIDAPMVKSYVFYNKKEALKWADDITFPKVFKLRGGAGSANVKLAKTKTQTIQLINKAFGKGFRQYDKWQSLKDRIKTYKSGKTTIFDVAKGVARLNIEPDFSKTIGSERGYVYFQDFIPNNDCDYRLKVVDNKCWGFRRMVGKNDFRASGSGNHSWDRNAIPQEMVQAALRIANYLGLQSVAFDFVLDENKNPLIIEISYGFGIAREEFTFGYWDDKLNWHEGDFNPMGWIIENLIQSVKK